MKRTILVFLSVAGISPLVCERAQAVKMLRSSREAATKEDAVSSGINKSRGREAAPTPPSAGNSAPREKNPTKR